MEIQRAKQQQGIQKRIQSLVSSSNRKFYTEIALVSAFWDQLLRTNLCLTESSGVQAVEIDDEFHLLRVKVQPCLELKSQRECDKVWLNVKILQMDRIFKILVQMVEGQKDSIKIDEYWFCYRGLIKTKSQNSYRYASVILKRLEEPQLSNLFLWRLINSVSFCNENFKTLIPKHLKHSRSNDLILEAIQSSFVISQLCAFLNLKEITVLIYCLSTTIRKSFETKLCSDYSFSEPKRNIQKLFKALYELEFGSSGFELEEIKWPLILSRKRRNKAKSKK